MSGGISFYHVNVASRLLQDLPSPGKWISSWSELKVLQVKNFWIFLEREGHFQGKKSRDCPSLLAWTRVLPYLSTSRISKLLLLLRWSRLGFNLRTMSISENQWEDNVGYINLSLIINHISVSIFLQAQSDWKRSNCKKLEKKLEEITTLQKRWHLCQQFSHQILYMHELMFALSVVRHHGGNLVVPSSATWGFLSTQKFLCIFEVKTPEWFHNSTSLVLTAWVSLFHRNTTCINASIWTQYVITEEEYSNSALYCRFSNSDMDIRKSNATRIFKCVAVLDVEAY